MTRFSCLRPGCWFLTALALFGCGASASSGALGLSSNTPNSAVGTVQHPTSTGASAGGLDLAPNEPNGPHDEHWRSLQRLLSEPWRRKADRDEQLLVPLSDAGHWKRVRFWLIDHFTGFRYGDDMSAVNVVLVQDVEPGVTPTAELCMKRAERWARPQMRSFDVRMGPIHSRKAEWHHDEIPVRTADAVVDYGFGPMQFSAAWAAYPAYTDACLVFAFAVPWGEHRELAQQVRERWIDEGVRRIKPLTQERPYRKPHDDD
jgi:hypothetical protein